MPHTYRALTVRHAVEADGLPVVYLPLATGAEVKLEAATYEWLKDAGYSMRWTTLSQRADGYVLVPDSRVDGRLLTAARIIAGAGKRQIVKYRDGDKLNLRRDNLRIEKGWAKRDDRSLSRAMASPIAARLLRIEQPQSGIAGLV